LLKVALCSTDLSIFGPKLQSKSFFI